MIGQIQARRSIDAFRRLTFPLERRITILARRWIGPIERILHPRVPVVVVRLDGHDDVAASASGAALFASTRSRFATASDVIWLTPERFAVVFLLTHAIAVLDFDDTGEVPDLRLDAIAVEGGLHGGPEAIGSPSDGRWIAVTLSETGELIIGRLSGETPDSEFEVLATLPNPEDHHLHGVAVTPSGRFIGFTSIGRPGSVQIARVVEHDEAIGLQRISELRNDHGRLKPKGIAFTPDCRFVILTYGCNAASTATRIIPGFIEVRKFDDSSGEIGDVVSRSRRSLRIRLPEVVAVAPDASFIVVTDQFNDSVHFIELDEETGRLGDAFDRIGRAAGGLSFPHGCEISPDQRWIAVSNYGDGTVRFFDAPERGITNTRIR